jgi:endonuclease/exonuclease/phosphatase family metal-dependent hydrolase
MMGNAALIWPPKPVDCVRAVSLNVYWLQGYPHEADMPGPPNERIVDELAALLHSADADALCLQELQDADVYARLSAGAGMEGAWIPGGEEPHYGGAVLWRRGQLLGSSSRVSPPARRVWLNASIPFGTDTLSICCVHLVSNKMGGAQAEPLRERDLQSLLTHAGEADIIAGDFNEGPGGGASAMLDDAGFVDAAEHTSYACCSTGIKKPRSDQIWVRRTAASRIADFGVVSWERFRAPCAGKAFLSDHLPLWLDMRKENR